VKGYQDGESHQKGGSKFFFISLIHKEYNNILIGKGLITNTKKYSKNIGKVTEISLDAIVHPVHG
jgi:hypothetical protein